MQMFDHIPRSQIGNSVIRPVADLVLCRRSRWTRPEIIARLGVIPPSSEIASRGGLVLVLLLSCVGVTHNFFSYFSIVGFSSFFQRCLGEPS